MKNGPELAYNSVEVTAVKKAATAHVTGELFICKEASDAFDLQFDNKAKVPCEAGFQFRLPFQRLTFLNRNSTTLTVNFFVGSAEVSYNFNYFQRPVRTLIKPWVNTLMSGSDVFLGTYLGLRRKFFCVQNDHATQVLDLKSASVLMGKVYCRQAPIILETDDQIEVANPTATPVDFYACEIFHLSP